MKNNGTHDQDRLEWQKNHVDRNAAATLSVLPHPPLYSSLHLLNSH